MVKEEISLRNRLLLLKTRLDSFLNLNKKDRDPNTYKEIISSYIEIIDSTTKLALSHSKDSNTSLLDNLSKIHERRGLRESKKLIKLLSSEFEGESLIYSDDKLRELDKYTRILMVRSLGE